VAGRATVDVITASVPAIPAFGRKAAIVDLMLRGTSSFCFDGENERQSNDRAGG